MMRRVYPEEVAVPARSVNHVGLERMGPELVARASRALRRRDPVLGAVIARVGPCALVPRGDPYRYLVRSVLFQQITGHAARAIEGRLKAAYGGRLPAPDKLRAAPPATLRSVGLSRQKIASLHAIATAFDDGTLVNRRLARLADDAVIEAVTQLRGVGEWTAHMMLMMSLGRPDVLPVGDYGVRKAARDLYGLADLPKPKELTALAEPWRPFRSIAAWYLWRSLDAVTP
jgi:DNA-3-methyladenine glycosylase II